MKIKNEGSTVDNNDYKLFNVVMEETPTGVKVRKVLGTTKKTLGKSDWSRLNARNFARSLNKTRLVTK